MTDYLKLVFFAVGVFFCTLVPHDAAAQATPLMFAGPGGQILTKGPFLVAGDPARNDLSKPGGPEEVIGMISLHGFYQGQIDPVPLQYVAFGQHPLWPIQTGTACCFPTPVPAVIRVVNFMSTGSEATLTLPLMTSWFPGKTETDVVVTINIGRVDLQRYGLDATFYVAADGRLFEDLGLMIPAN